MACRKREDGAKRGRDTASSPGAARVTVPQISEFFLLDGEPLAQVSLILSFQKGLCKEKNFRDQGE
jgi:hypothetical protein